MMAQDRSTTPTCTTCGYTLTGLERDAARMVVCPECGLRQEPRIAERHGLGSILLWSTLPTLALCTCCAVCLMLDWILLLVWLAPSAALVGVAAPIFGTAFAAGQVETRAKRAWPSVLVVGWGINLVIGTMFMGLAFSMV
jgi:predicted RNA-binding Zn-ribbon protein involved in translation (DUF1610 family)